ncbi:MAG: hypothetical protein FWG22_00140 [Prolixibacteraceae bacterium]|nr:hypothetical protein [Prolixibacteraceae bacterium]
MKTSKYISVKRLQKLAIFVGILVFACLFDHYHKKTEQDRNPVQQQKNEDPKEERGFFCVFSAPSTFSLKLSVQKDIPKNLSVYNILLKLAMHNNARAYHTLQTESLDYSPDILQRNLMAINCYYTSPSDDIPLFS